MASPHAGVPDMSERDYFDRLFQILENAYSLVGTVLEEHPDAVSSDGIHWEAGYRDYVRGHGLIENGELAIQPVHRFFIEQFFHGISTVAL